MKKLTISILLFISASMVGQNNLFIEKMEKKLNENQIVYDEEIFQLMQIVDDKTNNDSARVDAVYLLNRIPRDTCTQFLIERITYYFGYGDGISDDDQSKSVACWSALINRHVYGYKSIPPDNINERWRLLSLCLLVLQKSEKNEDFLALLMGVLSRTTSKEALKEILLEEKKRVKRFYQPTDKIYDVNLTNMLKLFN